MNRSVLLVTFVLVLVIALADSQRPPYAGSRPIGYKDRFRPRPSGTVSSTASTLNDIDNRFGELANNLQNNINVTQRPPVGVEVVYAEPGDLTSQQGDASMGMNQQDQQQNTVITTDNRLGLAQDQLNNNQQTQQQLGAQSSSSGLSQSNTENSTNDLLTGGSRKPSSGSSFAAPNFGTRPSAVPLNHVPYDAHGDVFLVNLLNERPVNQQPFWFVNYQAIEAHRNGTIPTAP